MLNYIERRRTYAIDIRARTNIDVIDLDLYIQPPSPMSPMSESTHARCANDVTIGDDSGQGCRVGGPGEVRGSISEVVPLDLGGQGNPSPHS